MYFVNKLTNLKKKCKRNRDKLDYKKYKIRSKYLSKGRSNFTLVKLCLLYIISKFYFISVKKKTLNLILNAL